MAAPEFLLLLVLDFLHSDALAIQKGCAVPEPPSGTLKADIRRSSSLCQTLAQVPGRRTKELRRDMERWWG